MVKRETGDFDAVRIERGLHPTLLEIVHHEGTRQAKKPSTS